MRNAIIVLALTFTACARIGYDECLTIGDYAEEFAVAASDWSAQCGQADPYYLQQAHDHVIWFVCDHYARENGYSCTEQPKCAPRIEQCIDEVMAMPCSYGEGEHFEWPASCFDIIENRCEED